jgi:hypothetical protein
LTIISSRQIANGHKRQTEPFPGSQLGPHAKGPAWEAHLTAIRDMLEPEGYLEACLVERIAELAWRIQALPLEGAGRDLTGLFEPTPRHVAAARIDLGKALDITYLLESLTYLDAGRPVKTKDAVAIILAVSEECDIDIDAIPLPGILADIPFDEFAGWDAGLVRQAVATVGLIAGREIAEMMKSAQEHAAEAVGYYLWLIESLEEDTERPVVPPLDAAQGLHVAESLLSAELSDCLAEYSIAQAARRAEQRTSGTG